MVGEDGGEPRLELDVDGASLRVVEGTGGMQALGDDDKADISQTIDDEILKRQRDRVPLDAGAAGRDGSGLSVRGRSDAASADPPAHVRRRRSARTARSPPTPSSTRPTGA